MSICLLEKIDLVAGFHLPLRAVGVLKTNRFGEYRTTDPFELSVSILNIGDLRIQY